MDYVGAKLDIGAAAESDGDDVPVVVQQDASDVGRTIFVQFTGDPDPSSPVRGDARIKQA